MRDDERIGGLAITFREFKEAERESAIGRKKGDGRVCLCGHPFNRHTTIREVTVCKPSRMSCSCRDQVAALEVQNTRAFLRKTTGVGERHALARGMVAAVEAGDSIAWLIPVECSQCGAGDVVPVGLRKSTLGGETVARVVVNGEISPEATRLLCATCLEGISR